MIKKALGREVDVSTKGNGHVIYTRKDGVILYDTQVDVIEDMRAVLFLEGIRLANLESNND